MNEQQLRDSSNEAVSEALSSPHVDSESSLLPIHQKNLVNETERLSLNNSIEDNP